MPRGRPARTATLAPMSAAQPLGLPPVASQLLGARLQIEPAGRSGVFRPGQFKVGNFIAFTAAFYNAETGAELSGVPAVTLSLKRDGDDPLADIAMVGVTGETGKFRAVHVPTQSGEWSATFLIPTWDVKLTHTFYVGR